MSEFKFVEKKSNLKISFERIAFIFFIFFIISLLFSAKILFLSYNDLPEQKIIKKKENFRSSIIDREGDILAKSVRITNLGICLLYTSPSPRDLSTSRMPSSA